MIHLPKEVNQTKATCGNPNCDSHQTQNALSIVWNLLTGFLWRSVGVVTNDGAPRKGRVGRPGEDPV